MITANDYEDLLKELACENFTSRSSNSVERIAEIIAQLNETQDIYKKSNIEGVFIKVGKLTTRNEIVLNEPIVKREEVKESVVSYERGWWYLDSSGRYRYLETKPYAVFKGNEVVEELCSIESEFNVLGYTTRLPNDNRLRDIVLYDQYL